MALPRYRRCTTGGGGSFGVTCRRVSTKARHDPGLVRRPALHGVKDIPRKPNYDFERREREKAKAGEAAKKAQAKAEKKAAIAANPDSDPPGEGDS